MLNTLSTEQINETTTAPVLTRAQTEERRRLTVWLDERVAASKKKGTAEVVTLVPALAQLLLERNPINRPISKRNAADLASDIANRRFMFNGESIVVSKTGVLLDGQHRCQQVVATGAPIETVIVFGPDDDARFTIDTGKSKTVSNFLAMKGRMYTHALGAAVNYHLQWRQFNYVNYASSPNVPTKAAILAAADELKGIDTSVEFTAGCMKTIRSHAVLAFCHYVFWKRSSREAADHFILKLIEGDELRKDDPILFCRRHLERARRGETANSKIELIFRAWNYHRNGTRIQKPIRCNGQLLPKVER
jgi:hypothetical protein